jgi:ATP-binding cassette, subfamily F, member 3
MIEVSGLVKRYDGITAVAGLTFSVAPGEVVGLVGPNGAGKSVLFRCILGTAGLGDERPDGGAIRLGPSIRVGYYAQEHDTLHPDWTVVQEIREAAPMYESDAYGFLGRFLFDHAAAQKQVRRLSGGERSRLQLARLVLSGANFLLLDEPTNNLDIPSAEVLEAALEEFNGTVLVISHDRYFLDRIVDRVVGLEAGELVEVEGGYSDYLAARA